MSQLRHTLEIVAPGAKRSQPDRYSALLKCRSCHGKGTHTVQLGHSLFKDMPCECCEGSGYMTAEITIDYKPFTLK